MTKFFSFDFHSEKSSSASSVDGVNFQLPPNPPVTEFEAFKRSISMCPRRDCSEVIAPALRLLTLEEKQLNLLMLIEM